MNFSSYRYLELRKCVSIKIGLLTMSVENAVAPCHIHLLAIIKINNSIRSYVIKYFSKELLQRSLRFGACVAI